MSLKPDTLKSDTLTPETISQLQTMIQADPALLAQLQSCTAAASYAAIIAKAAAAKGIEVSTPELVAHFDAAVARQGAMSDAELEQVAGGGVGGTLFISIASFGIACVVHSIYSNTQNTQCDKDMNALLPW